MPVNWRDYIVRTPDVLKGKPRLEHSTVFIIPTLAIAPVSASMFTFRCIIYPRNRCSVLRGSYGSE